MHSGPLGGPSGSPRALSLSSEVLRQVPAGDRLTADLYQMRLAGSLGAAYRDTGVALAVRVKTRLWLEYCNPPNIPLRRRYSCSKAIKKY